jgi:hypothetical protein
MFPPLSYNSDLLFSTSIRLRCTQDIIGLLRCAPLVKNDQSRDQRDSSGRAVAPTASIGVFNLATLSDSGGEFAMDEPRSAGHDIGVKDHVVDEEHVWKVKHTQSNHTSSDV